MHEVREQAPSAAVPNRLPSALLSPPGMPDCHLPRHRPPTLSTPRPASASDACLADSNDALSSAAILRNRLNFLRCITVIAKHQFIVRCVLCKMPSFAVLHALLWHALLVPGEGWRVQTGHSARNSKLGRTLVFGLCCWVSFSLSNKTCGQTGEWMTWWHDDIKQSKSLALCAKLLSASALAVWTWVEDMPCDSETTRL